MKLYIYGFPGHIGGACTELHHQLILWKRMGLEPVIIPSYDNHRHNQYNYILYSAVNPSHPSAP